MLRVDRHVDPLLSRANRTDQVGVVDQLDACPRPAGLAAGRHTGAAEATPPTAAAASAGQKSEGGCQAARRASETSLVLPCTWLDGRAAKNRAGSLGDLFHCPRPLRRILAANETPGIRISLRQSVTLALRQSFGHLRRICQIRRLPPSAAAAERRCWRRCSCRTCRPADAAGWRRRIGLVIDMLRHDHRELSIGAQLHLPHLAPLHQHHRPSGRRLAARPASGAGAGAAGRRAAAA